MAAITLAEATPTPHAERARPRTAPALAERLETTHRRELLDATGRAELVTPSSRRGPVTGAMNVGGPRAGSAGSALDGVPMLSMGAVVIDLPEADAVVEQHGQAVADRTLKAVAAEIVAVT